MPTHARRRVHPHTTLDADEQSELALKIRFGIGLEQLVGATAAAETRKLGMKPREHRRPHPAPVPREPDAGTHARAAALGLSAGRRGQWLRR